MDAKIMTLARECVARGWCEPDTSHMEMDAVLAELIARQVATALAAATERAEAAEASDRESLEMYRRARARADALAARLAEVEDREHPQ